MPPPPHLAWGPFPQELEPLPRQPYPGSGTQREREDERENESETATYSPEPLVQETWDACLSCPNLKNPGLLNGQPKDAYAPGKKILGGVPLGRSSPGARLPPPQRGSLSNSQTNLLPKGNIGPEPTKISGSNRATGKGKDPTKAALDTEAPSCNTASHNKRPLLKNTKNASWRRNQT